MKLSDLLNILIDKNIDFVLVGGFAGVVYGSTTVTQDIDICAVITPEQIDKLRECLKELHPRHRMTPKKLSFLEHPEDVSSLNNLYLETDAGVLDIMGREKDLVVVKELETIEKLTEKK